MCGCRNSAPRSPSLRNKQNSSRKAELNASCSVPITYYQELDISSWEPTHQAIVRSQINIYAKSCNTYYDIIRGLEERYSN